MGQFVGHHSGDFLFGQSIEQASGGGDGSVFGTAAGGEGVRLIGVQHIDLRHRQIRVGGQLFHHRNQLWRRFMGDFPGIVHAQNHVAGIPPREHVHGSSEHQGKQHACLTGQQKTNQHEQHGHEGQQYGCFHNIHLLWLRKVSGVNSLFKWEPCGF